jgi:hypothetical protein
MEWFPSQSFSPENNMILSAMIICSEPFINLFPRLWKILDGEVRNHDLCYIELTAIKFENLIDIRINPLFKYWQAFLPFHNCLQYLHPNSGMCSSCSLATHRCVVFTHLITHLSDGVYVLTFWLEVAYWKSLPRPSHYKSITIII